MLLCGFWGGKNFAEWSEDWGWRCRPMPPPLKASRVQTSLFLTEMWVRELHQLCNHRAHYELTLSCFQDEKKVIYINLINQKWHPKFYRKYVLVVNWSCCIACLNSLLVNFPGHTYFNEHCYFPQLSYLHCLKLNYGLKNMKTLTP